MKKALVVILLTMTVALAGCNAYQKAEAAYHVIEAILNVAKNEIPVLQQAGIYSPQDSAIAVKYITAVGGLNDQYQSCVTNAQNKLLGKTSKFLDCLAAFAGGLADPNELAALRIMNPNAQRRIQLYVVAFTTGLNVAISSLGGQQAPAVTIGPAPTSAELQQLELRVKAEMRGR